MLRQARRTLPPKEIQNVSCRQKWVYNSGLICIVERQSAEMSEEAPYPSLRNQWQAPSIYHRSVLLRLGMRLLERQQILGIINGSGCVYAVGVQMIKTICLPFMPASSLKCFDSEKSNYRMVTKRSGLQESATEFDNCTDDLFNACEIAT